MRLVIRVCVTFILIVGLVGSFSSSEARPPKRTNTQKKTKAQKKTKVQKKTKASTTSKRVKHGKKKVASKGSKAFLKWKNPLNPEELKSLTKSKLKPISFPKDINAKKHSQLIRNLDDAMYAIKTATNKELKGVGKKKRAAYKSAVKIWESMTSAQKDALILASKSGGANRAVKVALAVGEAYIAAQVGFIAYSVGKMAVKAGVKALKNARQKRQANKKGKKKKKKKGKKVEALF